MEREGGREAGRPGGREAGRPGGREAGKRLILAVARTTTSTIRLLDALDEFRGDPRVEVAFYVDKGSQFGEGVVALLRSAGARVRSRAEVAGLGVDLVLTASENADCSFVHAPTVVLPHGVGFHKSLYEISNAAVRLSGVPRQQNEAASRTVIVVTSHHQRAQLEAARPGTGLQAVVVRDPFFARLTKAVDLRGEYRHALGLRPGQKLVVVTSTWGEQSLWSAWRDLPGRLLAELPADDFRVAAILHPNVWDRHGPWQVRTWMADALDAGLLLVPAERGWPQVLVAADVVVGDHGSVSFYAAALGIPLLLAAFGEEVTPNTPLALIGGRLPRLGWREPLEPQLATALSTSTTSTAAVARQAFGEGENEPFVDLHTYLYDLLGLPPPVPALRVWPPSLPETPKAASFIAITSLESDGSVEIRCYPAAVHGAHANPSGSQIIGRGSRHLAVYDDEIDTGRRESASSWLGRELLGEREAWEWLSHNHNRCLILAVASPAGILVAVRDGGSVLVRQEHGTADWFEPVHAAALIHYLLLRGAPSRREAPRPDLTLVEPPWLIPDLVADVVIGKRRSRVKIIPWRQSFTSPSSDADSAS